MTGKRPSPQNALRRQTVQTRRPRTRLPITPQQRTNVLTADPHNIRTIRTTHHPHTRHTPAQPQPQPQTQHTTQHPPLTRHHPPPPRPKTPKNSALRHPWAPAHGSPPRPLTTAFPFATSRLRVRPTVRRQPAPPVIPQPAQPPANEVPPQLAVNFEYETPSKHPLVLVLENCPLTTIPAPPATPPAPTATVDPSAASDN